MVIKCLICYNCVTDYGFWVKRTTVLCGELKNVSSQKSICPKLKIEILQKGSNQFQSKH